MTVNRRENGKSENVWIRGSYFSYSEKFLLGE